MSPQEGPVLRDIVMVGGGHSHVVAIKRFGMKPVPGVRLTLVCRDTHTPYSGMLPGYIAGHYGYDDVHIDLRRLAEFAGARYVLDSVTGIDRDNRLVQLAGRPPLPYDLCSINIGSTPRVDSVPGAAEVAVPVKPINQFNQRWLALLERVRAATGPMRIAIVGGGAGGVELTLAMQYRLRNELRVLGRDPDAVSFVLFSASADVLATHNAGVRERYTRLLLARGVALRLGEAVTRVDGHTLHGRAGSVETADEVVWVTQAGGADWLRGTGLELDDHGFVRVRETLQSVTDPLVFAAGDVASLVGRPLEKAGVFAVRAGPPLADNLRRAAIGQPPLPWKPQRHWLSLISTGDRHAVASRGPFAFEGEWVWRWKDWIDRRFMRKYSEFPPMDAEAPMRARPSPVRLDDTDQAEALSALAMRCGGCGAKVGANVLSRALGDLMPAPRDDVIIGLHAPDDAAVVRVPPGKAMVQTVDFFRAFIDDPWLLGRIAANHALGDVFAMGGQPQTATAIVTVPPGLERKVEDTLRQLMTGANDVLVDAGCALVGGHTGEGRELALGFAVNRLIDENLDAIMRKGGMRPGDKLVLTKPIGTGTLFAAHALLEARGRWIDDALDSMQVSNRAAADIVHAHGATACTDLTGFGLLGHLVEMTRPSGVDARLVLSSIPVLDGAEETAARGILSSLQPANVRLRRALRNQAEMLEHPRYRLVFDPQTAGGLLASIPPERAEACLGALRAAGYGHAAIIGEIEADRGEALEPIVLEP